MGFRIEVGVGLWLGLGLGLGLGGVKGAPAAILCRGGGEHGTGQPRQQLLIALAQRVGPAALDARGGGAELFRIRQHCDVGACVRERLRQSYNSRVRVSL